MVLLWIIGFIALLLSIIYIFNKIGLDKVRVFIYILTIPLWIWAIFYYSDIRATILFGILIAFQVLNIYFYFKE